MVKSKLKLDLPLAADLFTTQEEREEAGLEKVMKIKIDLVDDFKNHPFKVRMNQKMVDLIESISQNGVLVPALVRPKEDGRYEMISGHCRKFASKEADLEEIPCVVRNLSDDEAVIILVDSNIQREDILPSEKAFAFQMKLEAMKRQGKRTDLTCAPLEHKLKNAKSRDILAEQVGESKDQIRRYIRLTELIPTILEMVDENRIGFRPAVEISYLAKEEQEILLDAIQLEEKTPSLSQAVRMKQMSKEERLDSETIYNVLAEEKTNQKEQIKFSTDRINKYFPKGTTKEVMEDTILKALEHYQKRTRDRSR